MKTSNFNKSGNDSNAVSICGKSPNWYFGREYKKLAPKYWFFKKYKEDGDEEFYTEQYYKEVLNGLDAKETFEILGKDSILICYENYNQFCHRFIVAEWLEKELGIEIREME